MSSEAFIVVQTVLLVVIISWAKAGLAVWSAIFIAAVVVIGLVGAPLLRRRETGGDPEIPWKASLPVLIFAVLGLIGFFNPAFRNPVESSAYGDEEELEVLAKREFAVSGNPVFLDRVMREMYFFRLQADPAREKRAELKGLLKVVAVTGTGELKKKIAELKKEIPKLAKRADMDRALARFLLAYRYVSIHHKTAFQPVFNRYLKDMRVDSTIWLPGTVTKETSWQPIIDSPWKFSIHRNHMLSLVFLQGIWVFSYLRNRRSIRWLMGALALNCVGLAAAGIVQKLSYDPSVHRPEIWGIWEAPEPRYYFASFTYKNHWCAYAALGFGILAGLTAHWLRRHPRDMLRGSPVPLALLGLGILGASIPLSGSVLGILLILTIGIPFIGFLCRHSLPKSWGWRRRLISCFVAVLLPASTVWVALASDPELKKETLQKVTERWQSLREGRLPWRYYHSKDSWAMFMDKPLWGWGLGSTPPLYPLYVSEEIIQQSEQVLTHAHHDERFFGLEYSHNDWFQYLAETGIGGVGLLVLTPLLALKRIRISRSFSAWSLLACLALMIYSFVDFPSRTPAFLIFFAVTLGCSLKYASRRPGFRD